MKRVVNGFLMLLAALVLLVFPAFAEQATDAPSETTEAAPETTPASTETPAPTEVPGPDVLFTRDFSSSFAEYGDKVTISYTVRNDGLQAIENIAVTDSLVGEVGVLERLEPGEKKTMSVRVRITEACVSKPGISYECGGMSYTAECSSEKIYLADVRLRVELDADKTNVAPGEMVTLRLNVVNEGNVNLYSLRAEEPVLGELGSLVSALPPGDECVVTRTVQMKGTNTFQFSITGTSDTGGAISVQSNEMSVIVTPVAAEILLSLRAEADKTELNGPGEVNFSLYVDNECSLELRNVVLSEETRGKVRELVFVPTGEMPAITETYEVTESGTYRFQAQVTDSVGDRLTVYSEPIDIVLVEATSEPSVVPTDAETTGEPTASMIPLLDGVPYRMEEDPATFEKLMLGTSLVLLAVLLIWYLAVKIKKKQERRRRARRRKQKKNKRANGKE